MVATPDFKFATKSQMRLEHSSNIVRFYNKLGRYITNTMIHWDPTIKKFKQEWEIFVKRKGEDVLKMEKISKALLITKWM